MGRAGGIRRRFPRMGRFGGLFRRFRRKGRKIGRPRPGRGRKWRFRPTG